MTSEAHSGVGLVDGRSPRAGGARAGGCGGASSGGLVAANFSSSLTRRIVSLNLGGLLALVVGVLWLNHFRADIIEARTQSLTTQAGIIAAAIAASAGVDANAIQVDPDKLLQSTPEGQAARRRTTTIRSSSRSIPRRSARCCISSSARPRPAPAFTTKTAPCCSTRRR